MAIITDQPATAADVKTATMKAIEVMVVDPSQEVDTTTGVFSFNAPSSINGYNLVRAQARIPFNGVPGGGTGYTIIQVRNLTKYPSNDALSTAMGINAGAYLGNANAINTSYDDVSTDDEIKIYVTGTPSTKAKGLMVVLEYKLP